MAGARASIATPDGRSRPRVLAGRGMLMTTWLRLLNDWLTLSALAVLGLIVTVSLLAQPISSQLFRVDPFRIDLMNNYASPSVAHPLGTDDLGRDVFARLLHAGQLSLTIGVMIAWTSILIGLPVGIASGFFGGRFDDFTNAVIQTLGNIPDLFLLILLSVTLRPSPVLLAVIIGAISWMGTARLVRAMTFSTRERDYVLAARTMGASQWRIMSRHVFPNIFSVITVSAGFSMVGGILGESGLSYLGLGVQPPAASWGNMLNGSLENFSRAVWLVLSPGIMIFVTVLCIYLIADGLRDAMDPRLRQ